MHPDRPAYGEPPMLAAQLSVLPDDALLERLQRRTFDYFWRGAHPRSGLAPDRRHTCDRPGRSDDDPVATGGSGFVLMALLVAIERGWIPKQQGLERAGHMLDVLAGAPRYHGAWPHFLEGATGQTVPFGELDDGGDLVETSLLCMGLLCARRYFCGASDQERRVRALATALWRQVEWDWYTHGDLPVLYWHWSPRHGWAMRHEIRGWNECLITYVLAAGSPTHPVEACAYHEGFAGGRTFINGNRYYGIELPLGVPCGGPLFFAHYSFCGLDPGGLRDRYADYWQQNVNHVLIHQAYCRANPLGFENYSADCWGLTASDGPKGYAAHAPDHDDGTISPTAALSSFPYAPEPAMRALRRFLEIGDGRLWGRYGFVDAFCTHQHWIADSYLAIDQGPIVIMIENHRSGLLWRLFMSDPDVREGLCRLGFESPWLDRSPAE